MSLYPPCIWTLSILSKLLVYLNPSLRVHELSTFAHMCTYKTHKAVLKRIMQA